MDHECASLLGSPLGGVPSIDRALKEKLEALRFMGSHFAHMSAHDALTLLMSLVFNSQASLSAFIADLGTAI